MSRNSRTRVAWALGALLSLSSLAARGQDVPPTKTEIVVSATKLPEDPAEIPNAVSVVTGEELRRSGVHTLADALQDVVGLDTGNGSDNGARLPNVGLWGLKEFDALLFTVDGVPIGGPFNPSLSQIPIEDVDRIEISKGPQGTLYGVSAFAGMIQVFTKRSEDRGKTSGSVRLGGGSFSTGEGDVSLAAQVAPDFSVRLFGSVYRSKSWQDRTDASTDRLTLSGEKRWGETRLGVSLVTYRDTNYFGSPLPVDAGEPIPGFEIDRNYAVVGARLDHRVYGLSSSFTTPLSTGLKLENTLGVTRDEQNSVRSFIAESEANHAGAAGVAIRPVESTVFDDLRLVADFQAAGRHRLVAGAALTWGRTRATGTGFDIELTTGPNPIVPSVDQTPVGDNRSFRDRRTFFGLYVNDEWTPIPRLTITTGARWDTTSESLFVQQQEVGTPAPDVAEDSRTDRAWSGGVGALVRLLEKPAGSVTALNFYVSLRSAFKPAAPNLSEAESARILDPERTRSGELGLKTLFFDRQLSFDVSLFHMNFENMVVATLDASGRPALINAGEERFQGAEIALAYRPQAVPGLSLAAGYAHHDATFVHFSFLTPDGELRVVDGKRLELVPRDLWNVKVAYGPETGAGGFVAVRHQGIRPLNRRNRFYADSFYEWDAGLGWNFPWGRVGVTGRNLGDDRHYTAESEIGDSQFYVAAPRRFTAEVTVRF